MQSDHYVQLVVQHDALYFPTSDSGEPSVLVRRYAAGDFDTIPWPMQSPHRSEHELRLDLAHALYDERECNDTFPQGCSDVLLPDGTMFSFDFVLCDEREQ